MQDAFTGRVAYQPDPMRSRPSADALAEGPTTPLGWGVVIVELPPFGEGELEGIKAHLICSVVEQAEQRSFKPVAQYRTPR